MTLTCVQCGATQEGRIGPQRIVETAESLKFQTAVIMDLCESCGAFDWTLDGDGIVVREEE